MVRRCQPLGLRELSHLRVRGFAFRYHCNAMTGDRRLEIFDDGGTLRFRRDGTSGTLTADEVARIVRVLEAMDIWSFAIAIRTCTSRRVSRGAR